MRRSGKIYTELLSSFLFLSEYLQLRWILEVGRPVSMRGWHQDDVGLDLPPYCQPAKLSSQRVEA